MLLVPRQVGLAVLLQSEVKGMLLMTTEALLRVHIGLPAVSYCWLDEEYSICKMALHVMKPKTSIPTKAMTIMPIAMDRDFLM